MRKEIYRMERDEALALLERAPSVHIATTTPEGAPVLRVVHGVVYGGRLCFHGAPVGEKTETVGREAVVSAEETVATIPSYFIDPERACPATTYFASAQVHGPIERIDDPGEKAEVLQRLMEKYQPEGGYAPIDVASRQYRKSIAGVLVLGVSLERLDGKGKLGQNRTPEQLRVILERLWDRGAPGDARAIDLLRAANPDVPTPAFLASPEGTRLVCALGPEDAASAAALLDGAYWNEGFSRDRVALAHPGSAAWVGARDASGALIATARALSDGAKRAWIFDVMVAPSHRGRGVGEAVVRLLVAHPAVRGAAVTRLGTRDAQAFYAKLGFRDVAELPPRPFPSTEMVLLRA